VAEEVDRDLSYYLKSVSVRHVFFPIRVAARSCGFEVGVKAHHRKLMFTRSDFVEKLLSSQIGRTCVYLTVFQQRID
jgi:hypothetical protein